MLNMSIFGSKIYLLEHFEKYRIDRKFLNIQKINKNIEFESISDSQYINHNITYHYKLNKKKINFTVCKIVLKTKEEIHKRYFDFSAALFVGEETLRKKIRKKNSCIGLPNIDDDTAEILEIEALIIDKSSTIRVGKEYLNIMSLRKSNWDKEIIEDFEIVSDKIIKKTLDKLKKIK